MAGPELRSAEFESHKFTNTSSTKEYAAGDLVEVDGKIGIVVENVGRAGTLKCTQFPNGYDGVIVNRAEKIILPKLKEDAFFTGDVIYYNVNFRAATFFASDDIRSRRVIGKALEPAPKGTSVMLAKLIIW